VIREWLQQKTSVRDWPTLREFKVQVISHLEEITPSLVPSQAYYCELLERVCASEFEVRRAQPIEEARYNVTDGDIRQHSANLEQIGISDISPHLRLNLDETGFGAFKSGQTKSQKVIVPNTLHGTPVFKENVESNFLTALCTISLAGDVLDPGRITKRGTDHPDGSQYSYFDKTRRYSSPKAFVTRGIFGDSLRNVISPNITSWRERIGPDARVIVIFDAHKAHLHAVLNAWAAADNIILCALPPHSSHLLQPLDQGFFRRLKVQYALFRNSSEWRMGSAERGRNADLAGRAGQCSFCCSPLDD
jgi:hypothetical protein